MARPSSREDRSVVRTGASAPGKCILMGEHAVVYGAPCLSVAVDLRTEVDVGRGAAAGAVPPGPEAPFLAAVVERLQAPSDLRFRVRSGIPPASGLGSSAALTVAATAAVLDLKGPAAPDHVADVAYRAERQAQGGGSPNDTSVSTAGGVVLLAPERHDGAGVRHLWTIRHADRVWEVHRVVVPPVGLVIGDTGVASHTGAQVAKVRDFVTGTDDGRPLVDRLGAMVWETLDALRGGDLEKTGKLMGEAQSALARMGAGHPALDHLLGAVAKVAGVHGAKLTGAGGGGSIVVLTDRPEAAAAAIAAAGGRPYIVATSRSGVLPHAVPAAEVGP